MTTIKVVAQRARVSVGTVSNVLNHPHLVSESTRQRVLAVMKEVGFERNEHARLLRLGYRDDPDAMQDRITGSHQGQHGQATRVCFALRITPEWWSVRRADRQHLEGELVESLKGDGWQTCSLFLGPDGLLVGYLEADQTRHEAAAGQWETAIAQFFADTDGRSSADSFVTLEEIVNVDEHLGDVQV